jgi:hypothetical protein
VIRVTFTHDFFRTMLYHESNHAQQQDFFMTHLREHWEGVSLPGDLVLEHWLGGDENAAFFQAAPSPDGRRAVVKLIPEASVDGAAQLDLWHRTRQLRHPNFLELLDSGRADLGGEIVLYAAFESPDDTLASALAQGPLSKQDAREVLDSILDALRYLHAQGLALGVLDPEHILAVGDRIKLSTDALRDAADSTAQADDIRGLGALWAQALMPASPRSAEIAPHASDPNPETRWSLAEITAALNPPTAPPPVVSAPPAPVIPVKTPAPAPPTAAMPEPAVPYNFPKWIVVGAAGLLLLILGLNLRRPAEVAQSHPVAPVSVPAPATEAPAPAPASAPPPAPVVTREATREVGREMWRVVAFTYRTHDAAAKKVRQLNQHHPDLHAAVFSPKERRGYYLVTLGGRMTHEDALRLQRSAKGKGLPRDLYVQNYSE